MIRGHVPFSTERVLFYSVNEVNKDNFYKNLPDTPGVYLMRGSPTSSKDGRGKNHLLYVGKAGNLKRRVSSYFLRPHDRRIEKLVSEIKKVDYIQTDTAIEALILEAELIKKYQPPFNVLEKDDKSFLYVAVTKDKVPRILLARQTESPDYKILKRFGPFTSTSSLREALKIIRKIFPFNIHSPEQIARSKRECLEHQIRLCAGACTNSFDLKEYRRDVRSIILFFEGKKKRILSSLQMLMKEASKNLEFEKAGKYKRQIFALQHIQDVAFIKHDEVVDSRRIRRIEGYDISNISGTSAVGSMVVFVGGKPDRDEYRKFRIKTIWGSNDVGMLREVLIRRFRNKWQKPDLILIDGGIAQVNMARSVLQLFKLDIPLVGLAKGPERKRNDILGRVPSWADLETLIRVRNEAHRFAIRYHKDVRSREFVKPLH